MSIEEIVELSRAYGSDPDWVLAGGGNTSFKDDASLYVKASGFALATIEPHGFARMDRAALDRIWTVTYPDEVEARESAALADLMAARAEGEDKRPSVETLMHELIPFPLVVHTHPALVNGVTCSQEGEEAAARIFGDDVLWIPAIEPGYVLAVAMKRAVEAYRERVGKAPQIILLQNHGLVIAGESVAEIEHLHDTVARLIQEHIARTPELGSVPVDSDARDGWHSRIEQAFRSVGEGGYEIVFDASGEVSRRVASRDAFAPVDGAFTPDHIVYAGERPLFIPADTGVDELATLLEEHRAATGALPHIVAVERLGVFALADTLASADVALRLFLDEVKIAAYAEGFGGARHLDDHLVAFIKGWEVERYRKKTSTGGV